MSHSLLIRELKKSKNLIVNFGDQMIDILQSGIFPNLESILEYSADHADHFI